MAILYIYGDRANFIPFYDELDNESNECGIQMIIPYKIGESVVLIFSIYEARTIYLLCYYDRDTEFD